MNVPKCAGAAEAYKEGISYVSSTQFSVSFQDLTQIL